MSGVSVRRERDSDLRDNSDLRDSRDRRASEARGRAEGLNVGWTVFSYLLSGMAAYGGIGLLIGRAVRVPMLFPIGMLAGIAISLGFVIWRYGRHGATAQTSEPREETSR